MTGGGYPHHSCVEPSLTSRQTSLSGEDEWCARETDACDESDGVHDTDDDDDDDDDEGSIPRNEGVDDDDDEQTIDNLEQG